MTDRPRVDILNFNFYDWDGDRVLIGGAERYVLELARWIGALGAQPRIVQNANRYFSKVYADVPVVGIPAATSMDLAAMSVGFRGAVSDAALVIASPVQLAAHLETSVPVIGINHGIHWDYPNNRVDLHDARADQRIVDAVLACTACVSVDTNFINWLRCFDAEATARVRYIPNFVDLDRYRATAKAFDLPRLELLFPRRLCAERGFRDLVDAFDAIAPRHPALDLHLCGTGPPEDEAIATALIGRHPGRVRWSQLGMDDMPAAYASSHIVLVPTVSAEGTSLSCIEAMATNNAIVTTPVGGLPNLVIDGYNGILVAPGARALAEGIERLADDRALVERLARNALTVVPSFSRDRWRARWATLLTEHLPPLQRPVATVSIDAYRPAEWPFGNEADREAAIARAESGEQAAHDARAAQSFAEQQLSWRDSELAGIKSSTGWAVLQWMYRIRFAWFPKGGRREAVAKWLMHRARSLVSRWRRKASSPAAGTLPASEGSAAADLARPLAPLAAGATARYTVVCLPILEWDFRIQRPQQVARQFVRKGHDVLFVKHTFASELRTRAIEPGVVEVELPGEPGTNPYRDRLGGEAAQRMAEALLACLAERGTGRFVCIAQLPFWSGVADRLREASGCDVVYDCMDLHAGFSSNTDAALVDERRLLETADLVVCSSQQLLEHAAPHAKRTALVRNGVDYEPFAAVPGVVRAANDALTIGYYGAIADWFDSDLVASIAQLRPQWRIVLVGSTWSADTEPLHAAPNVVLTGEKPYTSLPALIADWHCCIIPFRHTPLTAATNPVKVYEMLAAAKPVVSVGLPELAPLREAGLVALAEGGEAFVAAIEAQVAADDANARAARRAYAAANTWEARTDAIRAAVEALEPEVSIVVVTYNNRDLNELCLASLFNDTDYASFEVIVVDNASQDETPALLRDLAQREPRLRIVLNADNRGFSAANNQGAAIARGRYFCFLNNDTVVHGAWLRNLIGHLRRHAHLGLVGPVTNAIGNEAKIPVGYDALAGMPAWSDAHCAAHLGRLTEVSMLAFFCVAVPRWTWQRVGPLDERFGTGMFEDDDYNRRVRAAGFEVALAWDSFVHHWQRASFKLLGDDEYLRIYRENQAQFATKWSAATPPARDPLAALQRSAAGARRTVIFAPSVGWAIPLAQRPHHLARELARDGYVVVFDCTNAADDVDTLREVEPRLFLYKGPSSALAGLPRITLWTFSYNYDYRDGFPREVAVIYDWIDDLSVFPYDQRKLAAMHARALREADVVVSVARRLHDDAIRVRPDALYAPNAVEEGRFDREPDPNPALADPVFANLVAAGRPIAGYYGALANWFDYALLDATARLRPDWSFVLIGPDHDGSLARSGVETLQNVHALGPRPYLTLPGYLHRFDVATIPFAINDITLATSPLKLYEYFAAGKPVISTPMPECTAFEDVTIVDGAQAFAAALDVARRAGGDAAFRARLVALAARNTWRARARETMQALDAKRGREASERSAPAEAVASTASGDAQAHTPSQTSRASADAKRSPVTTSASNETVSPLAAALMQRFARLRTNRNEHFFDALCVHLAGSHDDPCLPMYFEFALSANDRGRAAAKIIEGLTPLSGRRALDVGCAYAGFLVALAERGAEPTGFDIDDSLLALAEHNFRDVGQRYPLHRADVTRPADVAAFRNAFDVITCNDVIEHVTDPAVAIEHVASMLRPGGLAYFEIPNRDDVAAVVSDGHYQLFGITQLEWAAARRYYAAHAPGVSYGVEHYLRVEAYRALFEAAGLSMALVPDPAAARSPGAIRAGLADLRKTMPTRLSRVPTAVRGEVGLAVARYLDEAEGSDLDDARFVERYGTSFWRIIARKAGAGHRDATAPSVSAA